jgi:hypothetical protein
VYLRIVENLMGTTKGTKNTKGEKRREAGLLRKIKKPIHIDF